uniref:CUB domain-containing protein n=1 Tax=Tetranychus urticae TaxID=32264 RepID=T1KTE2_TETUR
MSPFFYFLLCCASFALTVKSHGYPYPPYQPPRKYPYYKSPYQIPSYPPPPPPPSYHIPPPPPPIPPPPPPPTPTYVYQRGKHNCKEGSCPEPYLNRKDCAWLFTTTPGHRIKLVFEDFELETHPECASDH